MCILAASLHPAVAEIGTSPDTGCLRRYTCGASANAPFDPNKLTIVVTHGWNPLPNRIRLTTPREYARAICNRCGDQVNVFGWDWNAATFISPRGKVNSNNAMRKGRQLARELQRIGVRPENTWLIGHSLGALLMSTAASELGQCGQHPIARLTLLDAVRVQHDTIFGELNVRANARCVENYWGALPTGLGKRSRYAGVYNRFVRGVGPIRALRPTRSNHVRILEWYYETIINPSIRDGFNR